MRSTKKSKRALHRCKWDRTKSVDRITPPFLSSCCIFRALVFLGGGGGSALIIPLFLTFECKSVFHLFFYMTNSSTTSCAIPPNANPLPFNKSPMPTRSSAKLDSTSRTNVGRSLSTCPTDRTEDTLLLSILPSLHLGMRLRLSLSLINSKTPLLRAGLIVSPDCQPSVLHTSRLRRRRRKTCRTMCGD